MMTKQGRISEKEALELYVSAGLNDLSKISTQVREQHNGNTIYYNRNFHLEPSNVCVHRCKFCSYRRDDCSKPGAWSMSIDEVREYCISKYQPGMTEIHIVGSVDPQRDFSYYCKLVETVREVLPSEVTIKAFSAVEIDDMAVSSELSVREVLSELQSRGVSALPGGGAEIFSEKTRSQICPDKCSADRWLEIHRTAHSLGMRTNCTMLFGHLESLDERIEHLSRLRQLQDETGGFDAFIPLKFRATHNNLSHIGEASIIEVMKTFAISRLFLDNIKHIKSYWPMLGKELCQVSLLYGADDIDGTINDSTKIYSLAGAEEKNPGMSAQELVRLAAECGYNAVERDSFYNELSKK